MTIGLNRQYTHSEDSENAYHGRLNLPSVKGLPFLGEGSSNSGIANFMLVVVIVLCPSPQELKW